MGTKRYRYRAYPNGGQRKALARLFGCCRTVFNDAITARETAHKEGLAYPSAGELSKRLLTEAKRTEERQWLADVSAVALQQALRDADRAYNNFFASIAGKRKGRRMQVPRRKKKSNRQSARFSKAGFEHLHQTTHEVGFVYLTKIGRVRFVLSRPLPADPTSVTIIKEPDGRYYLSFVVDVPSKTPPPPVDRVAGIDVGLGTLAAIVYSDGTRENIANPRWLERKERALARAQKEMDRKKEGSKNWHKKRVKVAALHRKVRETRRDHHHKLARRLVDDNQVIAVEGLLADAAARGMYRKGIADAGWFGLIHLIEEKAAEAGRQLIKTPPFEPTSQVCSVCGTRDGKKDVTIREWTCAHCGAALDRDYNAAVNVILAAGLAESLNAGGGDVRLRLAGADPDEAGTRRTDRSYGLRRRRNPRTSRRRKKSIAYRATKQAARPAAPA